MDSFFKEMSQLGYGRIKLLPTHSLLTHSQAFHNSQHTPTMNRLFSLCLLLLHVQALPHPSDPIQADPGLERTYFSDWSFCRPQSETATCKPHSRCTNVSYGWSPELYICVPKIAKKGQYCGEKFKNECEKGTYCTRQWMLSLKMVCTA